MPPPYREPHKQGSNKPRAIFYFVREHPQLLTGTKAAKLVAKYLKLAVRETEPGRFEEFLGIVEDDSRVPEGQRNIPQRGYALQGQVLRVPRLISKEVLDDKLHHVRTPGTPSTRAPVYHREALCVIYVGSYAFLLMSARHNLEEAGILRDKWMDFSIRVADLVPDSEYQRQRGAQEHPDTYAHIDCFEKERFNSDSFDEFARRIGLRGRRSREILSSEEAMARLGLHEEEPCN